MKKIVLLIFFSLNVIFTNAQWVAQNSGTVDNLSAVFFPNANVGYMSANGYLLKTTNGGSSWNSLPSTSPYNGSPLFFTSIDTGYACGFGGILKTVDGGLTWVDNFPFPNIANSNIFFPTKSIGYAVTQNLSTDSLFTYKTINAGTSWILQSSSPSGPASSIFFTNALTGSMVLESVGIYKTIDGGITWTPKLTTMSSQFLFSLQFPSSTVGYAVGGDSIFKTTDAGSTWNNIYFPNSFPYNAVYFTSIDTGYAAGGDGFSTGVIRKTVDGGLTWTLSNTNPYTFQSLYFPNSSTGYACGQSGIIYKYGTTSGINENDAIKGVLAYPNPCNGKFKLSIDEINPNLNYKISVLDVLGNTIQQTEMHDPLIDINISEQSKGIYFVKIENEEGAVMKKMIKQ